MKKWLLLLCTVTCLWACGGEGDIPVPPDPIQVEKAPLTILAYLVANNNLDDDLLANIGTMYDGLATMDKAATLLVYWDGKTTIGANKSSHLILKYETDGKGNINGVPALNEEALLDDVLEVGKVMKEYTAQLSTDKQVMTKVLKDMVGMSPTERIGLVTGSHASSWLNSIYLSRSRAFGQDGSGTDNTMLIADMVEAMKSVGRNFDFVLFDACFMGTAEVAYAFREVADYQISSVMEVPAYGFPYDVFMKDLYKGTVDGYKQVCKSYVDFYEQRYEEGYQAWATISLVDSKEVSSLVDCIKAEIVEHKDLLSDYDVAWTNIEIKENNSEIKFDINASFSENDYYMSFLASSLEVSSVLSITITHEDNIIASEEYKILNNECWQKQIFNIKNLPLGKNSISIKISNVKDGNVCYLKDFSFAQVDFKPSNKAEITKDYISIPGNVDLKLATSNGVLSIKGGSLGYGLQEYGRQGGPDIAYDLEQFMKDLNGGSVPDSFKAQLDKTVIYKSCLEKAKPSNYSVDASNYCGQGIYIPIESRSKWNTYFKTIDWFAASGWNEVTFSWNF